MQSVAPVLIKVMVLFVLIIVGYAARKLNVFSDHVTKGLNSILIKITLPALIISSLQKEFSVTLLGQSAQLLIISFSVYAASFVFAMIFPYIIKTDPKERGVHQFVIMFSNVGFMGFPVLNAVFGGESLFYAAIYNLPFNLLTFTVGVMLLVWNKESGLKIDRSHIINPNVVAVIIGFSLFLLSIKLPVFIGEPIKMVGDITIPLSMIVVGAMLTRVKFYHIFTNWRIYVVSFLRLILIPLAAYFILKNIVTDKLLLGVIVIIVAMPAAVSTPILAEEYGANSDVAAKSVFISTLFSILTIPLITSLVLFG